MFGGSSKQAHQQALAELLESVRDSAYLRNQLRRVADKAQVYSRKVGGVMGIGQSDGGGQSGSAGRIGEDRASL